MYPGGKLGKYRKDIVKVLNKATHKPDEFFTQTVIAKGNHIQIFVNGKQTVDVTDESSQGAKSGVLALQLHAGSPMEVQFKDLTLKPLK